MSGAHPAACGTQQGHGGHTFYFSKVRKPLPSIMYEGEGPWCTWKSDQRDALPEVVAELLMMGVPTKGIAVAGIGDAGVRHPQPIESGSAFALSVRETEMLIASTGMSNVRRNRQHRRRGYSDRGCSGNFSREIGILAQVEKRHLRP